MTQTCNYDHFRKNEGHFEFWGQLRGSLQGNQSDPVIVDQGGGSILFSGSTQGPKSVTTSVISCKSRSLKKDEFSQIVHQVR